MKSGSISIYVPAVPIAQPRHRTRVVTPEHGKPFATQYEAAKTHAIHTFKAAVQFAAREVYKGPPIQEPVILSTSFVFPRPKSLIWKSREMIRLPHTKKPDRDNLDKAVLDALKGVVLADDCQVYAGSIYKWIAAGDEQPHVAIEIAW